MNLKTKMNLNKKILYAALTITYSNAAFSQSTTTVTSEPSSSTSTATSAPPQIPGGPATAVYNACITKFPTLTLPVGGSQMPSPQICSANIKGTFLNNKGFVVSCNATDNTLVATYGDLGKFTTIGQIRFNVTLTQVQATDTAVTFSNADGQYIQVPVTGARTIKGYNDDKCDF